MSREVVVLAELVQVCYLEGPLAQDEVWVDLGHGLHGVGHLVVGEADDRLEVPEDAPDAGESDVDAVVEADPAQLPAAVILTDLVADGDPAERHESRVGDVRHGDLEVLQIFAVLGQLDQRFVVALGLKVDVGEPLQTGKSRPQQGLAPEIDLKLRELRENQDLLIYTIFLHLPICLLDQFSVEIHV